MKAVKEEKHDYIGRSKRIIKGVQSCTYQHGNYVRYKNTDAGASHFERCKFTLLYVGERGKSGEMGKIYISWI